MEIRPGQRALTAYLLAKIPQLITIEVDGDLISILKQRWDHTRLVLYPEDTLTFDFSQLADESKLLRIETRFSLLWVKLASLEYNQQVGRDAR